MKKLVKIFVPSLDNSIVIDPFAGSGTTLLAAKKLGINYLGIEIVSEYIDIINQRLDEVGVLQKTLPFAQSEIA